MINFSNLEYFLVLTEELNFTAAAKKLFISQQSLSAHIARMEEEVGAALFERTKPLKLTAVGAHLKKRAQEMLNLRAQTIRELSGTIANKTEKIVLGISYAYSRTLLPKILPVFFGQYPNISLTIYERNAQDLDEALNANRIDMIFGRLPFFVKDIQTVPILEDKLVIMMPDKILDAKFGLRKDEVIKIFQKEPDLQMLKDCPFLLTSRGRVRNLSNDIFLSYNIVPWIVTETETIETAVMLCCSGVGILISPSLFLKNAISPEFFTDNHQPYIFPLPHHPYGTIAFAYQKKRLVTDAMQAFIDTTKQALQDL